MKLFLKISLFMCQACYTAAVGYFDKDRLVVGNKYSLLKKYAVYFLFCSICKMCSL